MRDVQLCYTATGLVCNNEKNYFFNLQIIFFIKN